METLAFLLAALAVVLAIPVPKWLHTARFRVRSPWVAMVLWQAIALAGGLAIIGAPIVYGLSPFGNSLPSAFVTLAEAVRYEDYAGLEERDVHPSHIFALCLGALLAAHLLLTLARTFYRVRSARRRHREMVNLLSTPLTDDGTQALPDRLTDTHVIEHEAPLAYCLPGRTNAGALTVLSRGLLDQLSPEELGAVIAHEKTHLRQRHHFLTLAFEAWYRALPWLPTTRYGREAVLELTEMLADDGALGEHSRTDLLRSIATTTPGGEDPEQQLSTGQGGIITGARLQRLIAPPEPLGPVARAAVLGLSAALLAVPTGLLLFS
ncbi:M56 family metallopeptidase [Nesterenkonia alba]|uniref:M56 family metallopeptidase n=1 Tax=Nesterenkonia alba TaxID=515814 RepID=UPI0003B52A67|nr:M56 family metallopeptidase [Nesterenkonia alba]